ncbi:S41 family peptidase [Candidatus Nomurabacteria bacterium]|nr:MAG: S41 family peptidase [Candidatus Nomurabacteria bacterium]
MEKIKTNFKYVFASLVIIVVIFFAGVSFGYNNRPAVDKVIAVTNKEAEISTEEADFAPFWEVWNEIEEKYPDAKNISNQDKIWGATKGLVESLGDPHSNFFDPKETKSFEESINGEFSGIGIEIGQKDGVLVVIAPLENTPADKAGLRSGDLILKINSVSTADMTLDEAIELIRGDIGTEVKLTVLSLGSEESREVSVVGQIIEIPTLSYKMNDDGIFVISLYNFSSNATDLFDQAMYEFSKSNTNKLIVDVRGNPGGYLDGAVDISSWFIPKGQVVAIESYGGDVEDVVYRSHGYNIGKGALNMVILVDEGSASASEIFAGALQEYGKATLIGNKTYGKGSVQQLIPITDTTSLKLTIAKWLTPNGVSLTGNGLDPDISVPVTKEDLEAKKDTQMQKAIEFLK